MEDAKKICLTKVLHYAIFIIVTMFTVNDILKIFPETSRTGLATWRKRGQVKTTVQERKRGKKIYSSFENLCQIELFLRLNEQKLPREQASAFAFDKKTEAAFRVIKSLGGVNELAKRHYGSLFKEMLRGKSKYTKDPTTLSIVSSSASFPIKIALFLKEGKWALEFYDLQNEEERDEYLVSSLVSDQAFIMDGIDIALNVYRRIEKAGLER